jgi:peptide/nickel transport system permease protein
VKYALRRLGFYLLAAFSAVVMNFLIPRLMPGDPASTMFARFQGRLQPEALDALRAAFGFTDAPLHVQFATYFAHLLRGDLGLSTAYYPATVSEVLGTGLLWTVLLAGVSMVIAFSLGTTLGALAAWRRNGWLDSVAPPALALIGAFPYFWLAMLALYVFGFTLEWFPLRHAHSPDVRSGWTWAWVSNVAWHAALPATTIVVASLGGWLLSMRNTMISVLGTDYVAFARARGLTPRRVLVWYAARNALLPNVTGFGMALGFVLSGSLLTEIVFSYPGLGYLMVVAVRNQDYPLMQGLFLAITLAVLAANWFVDLAYVWLDPRTRDDA